MRAAANRRAGDFVVSVVVDRFCDRATRAAEPLQDDGAAHPADCHKLLMEACHVEDRRKRHLGRGRR